MNCSQEELAKVLRETAVEIEILKTALKNHFDNFDWEAAKDSLAKMVFFSKIQQEAKEKLHHLG